LAYGRVYTVRGNGGATVDDAVQYVEHVAASDFMHYAATPVRQDMLSEQPLGSLYRSRAVRASHVALEKLLDDVLGGVGLGCAGRNLLAGGVASLGDGAQRLGAEPAGSLQVDGGIRAEGELSRCAVVPVADRPGFAAARLHDQVEAR